MRALRMHMRARPPALDITAPRNRLLPTTRAHQDPLTGAARLHWLLQRDEELGWVCVHVFKFDRSARGTAKIGVREFRPGSKSF